MKFFLVAVILLFSFSLYAQVNSIYDTQKKISLSYTDFISELSSNAIVVLGEYHNTNSIQNAQADIITDTVRDNNFKSDFAVHWEFLNFTEQENIQKDFISFKNDLISENTFLSKYVGSANFEYAPILTAIKQFDGYFYGTNLPRKIKQQVIKGGLSSIDQALIPLHHYVGDQQYFERFKLTMVNHIPESMLNNYFEAQCLTDSVIAYNVIKNAKQINFLIEGSFHTDFYGGTVERLKKLTSQKIVTLKLVDVESLSEEEKIALVNGHSIYGNYADYIVFTEKSL